VAQKKWLYFKKDFSLDLKAMQKTTNLSKYVCNTTGDVGFLLKVSVDNLLEKGIYLLENLSGC